VASLALPTHLEGDRFAVDREFFNGSRGSQVRDGNKETEEEETHKWACSGMLGPADFKGEKGGTGPSACTTDKQPSAVYGRSGRSQGISSTVSTSTRPVSGTPIRTKSPKRYLPGTSTSVLTGEETGVMNAAEAAMATVMTKG
jgi:hypothetical protein